MKNSILSLIIASFALGSLPSAQAAVKTYDIEGTVSASRPTGSPERKT
jgi:hypothetical protein